MPIRLNVNPRSGFPLYLQIIEQIQRAVAIGVLQPGEQLPTVKRLASELVINASTVAKALRDLERLRVVTSLPGRGTYISENGATLAARLTAESAVAEGVARVVREARSLEIDGEMLRNLFERAYSISYEPGREGAPE